MRKRFSIVITDVHGSKHYNIHNIIKKILLYTILMVIILLIFGGFFISYLTKSVNDLKLKKQKLSNIHLHLKTETQELSKAILEKEENLVLLNKKMDEIEKLIGVKPNYEEVSLKERVNLAKISILQKQFLFQNIPNGYPINNQGITDNFGWRRHPILKTREFHSGIDLKAKMGTKIFAPADGIINFSGYHKKSGYGIMIILDHNYGFKTLYGHLNKVVLKKGDMVRKGELIGYTGNTGLSNGPHLHYEVLYLQTARQPINFMQWSMTNYEKIFKQEKYIKWQSLINLMTKKNHQAMLPQ